MIRRPCVAGQFYPASAEALEEAVTAFLRDKERRKAVAVISPHAGYIYSGAVAGEVYSSVAIPDDVILLGPNHTGLGPAVSVMDSGSWELPNGAAEINEGLAKALIRSSSLFTADASAHLGEHSLEVQLPFLLHLKKTLRIVPVTIMRASGTECVELGRAVAEAVKAYDGDVLIVVSSDMNHYESDSVTRKKDKLAIERILSLDAPGLLTVTSEKGITMCGVLPAAVAITAAKELGARGAELVKYATSAETSGDYSHVVGYAGIIIK